VSVEVFVVIWIISGIAAAMIASSKGREPVGWFINGLLFGIFGLIVAIGMQPTAQHQAQRATEVDRLRGTQPPPPAPDERECPFCAEWIKSEAIKCKHCGSDLSDAPAAPLPPPVTKRVPSEGLPVRNRPDSQEEWARRLKGGSLVSVLDQRGAWARVRTRDGEVFWVDGRRLI
jgi:hypothetical protein